MHLTIFGEQKIAIKNEKKHNLKHHCEEKEARLLLFKYCEAQSHFLERCENEFIRVIIFSKIVF
jgi:hypothetical protein